MKLTVYCRPPILVGSARRNKNGSRWAFAKHSQEVGMKARRWIFGVWLMRVHRHQRLLVRPLRAVACAILMMASAAALGSYTRVGERSVAESASRESTTNPRQLRAMQLLDRRTLVSRLGSGSSGIQWRALAGTC